MKINKTAFTLVELLAVIVVLGLLMVIIIPKVTKSINESEEKVNETNAENLLNAAIYKATSTPLDENIIVNYETGEGLEQFEYNGKKPEKGFIAILKNGHVVMAVKIGDNCYIKKYSDTQIIKQKYTSDTCNAPTSFETDTWETIANAVRTGETEMYNVGDTKTIKIDTTTLERAVFNRYSINQGPIYDYTLRLANKSAPSKCNENGFSQTACGFVIEFADVISYHNMNSTSNGGELVNGHGNVGGWPACEMRQYLNETIYNLLPNDLKSVIVDTNVVSSYGRLESANFESTDKIFLLDLIELAGENNYRINDDSLINHTRQLDYYENLRVTNEESVYYYLSHDRLKKGYYEGAEPYGMSYIGVPYWLRTADLSIKNNFGLINYDGEATFQSSTGYLGVSPAFKIG